LICSAKTKDQAMAAQDARAADVRGAPLTETSFSYVHWGAIIAGALAAAALAFVLQVSMILTSTSWRMRREGTE
jgi:formate/nitrite transporter FocA (FNT family)